MTVTAPETKCIKICIIYMYLMIVIVVCSNYSKISLMHNEVNFFYIFFLFVVHFLCILLFVMLLFVYSVVPFL